MWQLVFKDAAVIGSSNLFLPVQFKITADTLKELPKKKLKYVNSKMPSERMAPFYPYNAIVKRMEGTTVLHVTVSTNGYVSAVTIQKSSGHEILDWSAVATAYRWVFACPIVDGQPVVNEYSTPISFKLSYH